MPTINESYSAMIPLTIDGDAVTPYQRLLPAGAIDGGQMGRSAVRADFWIWHEGVDKDNNPTSNKVYVVTADDQTADDTPWRFDDTNDIDNPLMILQAPVPHKLLFFCAPGTSVKIRYRYVISDAGPRTR